MPKISSLSSFAAILLFIAIPSSAAPENPGPLRQQLDDRFSAIDREIIRLQKSNQPAQAKKLADQLQYFRDRLAGKAKPPDNEPELHVLGCYQGQNPDRQPHGLGHATVAVGLTDRPIILVLCSYEPVEWNLKIADGAKIQKIILSGYYDQKLSQPLNNIPLEIYSHETNHPPFFYAYAKDAESYPAAAKALKQLTGKTIFTFQGSNTAKQPFIIARDNEEWLAQCLLRETEPLYTQAIAFDLAAQRDTLRPIHFQALELVRQNVFNFSAALRDFTPLGNIQGASQALPQGIEHFAVDPAGPTYYGIDSHTIYKLDLKTGQKIEMPINAPNLPRLSWACGLTFDTKRSRLILVSLGGEGFIYAYSPQNKQWSLIGSMNNLDLQSLTYSPEHDCFFGLAKSLGENSSASIVRISAKGQIEKKLPISDPMPPTRPGPHQGFQLISAGRQLALLTPPHPDPENPDGADIVRCLLIDPQTAKVSYSGTLQPQPAPQQLALAPKEIDALWQTVQDGNLVDSDQAMWKLAAAGDKLIPFLREKFPPLPASDPQKIADTLAKLEHQDFKTREQAASELRRMRPPISAALQQLQKQELPPSTRTYIDEILKNIETDALDQNPADSTDPSIRLESRAIAILGRIATPSAIDALKSLSAGPPGLPRTTQAKSTLLHLGQD